MKYLIFNHKDNINYDGLEHQVIVWDEPNKKLERRVVQEDDPQLHPLERKKLRAPYDSALQHRSTIMKGIEWIIDDSLKRGSINDVQIQFSIEKKLNEL